MKELICRCGGHGFKKVSDHVAPSWDGKNLYAIECDKCHNHTSWFADQKKLLDIWEQFYGVVK